MAKKMREEEEEESVEDKRRWNVYFKEQREDTKKEK